jgi:EAL and modified HD-GYP domain-containing signal transduction protein
MFCELIGQRCGMHKEMSELFLMGLLSVMDVLLNMRMIDVLKEIPVAEDIKKALLGRGGKYRAVFEVVLDYETGTWEQLAQEAQQVGLHENFLPELYMKSVKWVCEVLAEVPVAV